MTYPSIEPTDDFETVINFLYLRPQIEYVEAEQLISESFIYMPMLNVIKEIKHEV